MKMGVLGGEGRVAGCRGKTPIDLIVMWLS